MPLDADTRARLAALLQRDANPSGYDEHWSPTPPARSGMANLLMALRDKVPENTTSGWSGVNMLRGALERSANLQDTVGGYRDPSTADPLDLVPMLAPGAIASAFSPRRNMLMSGGTPPPKDPPGFTAYHGSPHDFDRFSMDKIGTGEGAQAYGHGLYFADAEPVARQYRDSLSGPRGFFGLPSTYQTVQDAIARHSGNRNAALEWLKSEVRKPELSPSAIYGLNAAIAEFDKFSIPIGHMYEVRIKADPNEFLDWDKPLKDQTPSVVSRLTPEAMGLKAQTITTKDGTVYTGWVDKDGKLVGTARKGEQPPERLYPDHPNITPQNLVRSYLSGDDAGRASGYLRDAGIPGIRYDDAMTRGKGEGTRNTVVFDDKLIEIIRKYGLIGALMGGTAASGSGPQDY